MYLKNALCIRRMRVVSDVPDAPRFLQIENIYHDSVLLSWKAPLNDGGSSVTQYVVEKLEPPMTKWIRCCVTRFTHCAVENLSATKQYQFRVSAENLNGRSQPCEPSSECRVKTGQWGVLFCFRCVDNSFL